MWQKQVVQQQQLQQSRSMQTKRFWAFLEAKPIWRLIMLVIGHIPEAIFKRLSL